MSNYVPATFRVPAGESGLSRVFAAINAVDPRLQRFALHIFRGTEAPSRSAAAAQPAPLLPGPTAAISTTYKHYFLHQKPPVFADGGPLSASFLTDGTRVSETPFWVLVVYLPDGPRPFPNAPETSCLAAVMALEDMVYCFAPDTTRRLCSSVSYLSTACDRLMPVDARRLIPYLHEPRWSLDRWTASPDPNPTSDGAGLLDLMVAGRLDLPGVSYEPLTHHDLSAMQRLIFSSFARWVDTGPLVHRYFGGNPCISHPCPDAKMARHPNLGHWLEYEITTRVPSATGPSEERSPAGYRPQGGANPTTAAQQGEAPAVPALSTVRSHVGDMMMAYAVDRFLLDLRADEREVRPEVRELLHDRGLLSAIISTVAEIDCETAYEFGSAGKKAAG